MFYVEHVRLHPRFTRVCRARTRHQHCQITHNHMHTCTCWLRALSASNVPHIAYTSGVNTHQSRHSSCSLAHATVPSTCILHVAGLWTILVPCTHPADPCWAVPGTPHVFPATPLPTCIKCRITREAHHNARQTLATPLAVTPFQWCSPDKGL